MIYEIEVSRPKRYGDYRVMLGERDLGSFRTPFFAAARMLQSEGASGDSLLQMRHAGSPVVAMRAPIGKAAKRSVQENEQIGPRLTFYAPFPSAAVLA